MAFNASSGIRIQDIKGVFESLAENKEARELAWRFIENNFDMILS